MTRRKKGEGLPVTHISGCSVQFGPASGKVEMSDVAAGSFNALARAIEANAMAAVELARAMRGGENHYHGNGISIGGYK